MYSYGTGGGESLDNEGNITVVQGTNIIAIKIEIMEEVLSRSGL